MITCTCIHIARESAFGYFYKTGRLRSSVPFNKNLKYWWSHIFSTQVNGVHNIAFLQNADTFA